MRTNRLGSTPVLAPDGAKRSPSPTVTASMPPAPCSTSAPTQNNKNNSETPSNNIKIILHNVRGLAAPKKRQLYRLFAASNCDVAVMIETHTSLDNYLQIGRSMASDSHFAFTTLGSSKSSGVGVVALNPRYTITKMGEYADGRILDAQINDSITHSSKTMRIVYAPSDTDSNRCSFFQDDLPENIDEDSHFDLVLGDWNCCAHAEDVDDPLSFTLSNWGFALWYRTCVRCRFLGHLHRFKIKK